MDDKVSLILSAVLGIALVILIAPGILALNRGKALRNIALWLAIAVGLTLVYRATHPEAISTPAGEEEAVPGALPSGAAPEAEGESPPPSPPSDEQGYTPPKE